MVWWQVILDRPLFLLLSGFHHNIRESYGYAYWLLEFALNDRGFIFSITVVSFDAHVLRVKFLESN